MRDPSSTKHRAFLSVLLRSQGCCLKAVGIPCNITPQLRERDQWTAGQFRVPSRPGLSCKSLNHLICLLAADLLAVFRTNMNPALPKGSTGDWGYCCCFREWPAQPSPARCWQPGQPLKSEDELFGRSPGLLRASPHLRHIAEAADWKDLSVMGAAVPLCRLPALLAPCWDERFQALRCLTFSEVKLEKEMC